jgi:hypothetical protein
MPKKEPTHFERGLELGRQVKENHDKGGDWDVRYELAAESRSLNNREHFAEFMRGLESAWEETDA